MSHRFKDLLLATEHHVFKRVLSLEKRHFGWKDGQNMDSKISKHVLDFSNPISPEAVKTLVYSTALILHHTKVNRLHSGTDLVFLF